jgi:hypothetical protein
MVVGGLAGFIIANFILQFPFTSGFSSYGGRITIIIIFVLIGAIAAFFLADSLVLIVATAIIGSFLIFSGLDYWVRSGFNLMFYRASMSLRFSSYSGYAWLMCLGFFIVALLGIGYQLFDYRKHGGFKPVRGV